MATAKMGRPVSQNPKNITVKVRMDKQTVDKLDTCCNQENTNRSSIIRKGIDRVYDDLKKK